MATTIHRFCFNPLQENTYLLIDNSTLEAAIIDPGCSTPEEEAILEEKIAQEKAKPVLLLVTHLHFDHIWGVPFVAKRYGLTPRSSLQELEKTPSFREQAEGFMVTIDSKFQDPMFEPLKANERLLYGESALEVLSTPGHSAGHVTYYNRKEHFAMCGDVVFRGNIGRCDLKGGNYGVMLDTLRHVFIPLPGDTILYPGHGAETTMKNEKNINPYIISQL